MGVHVFALIESNVQGGGDRPDLAPPAWVKSIYKPKGVETDLV